MRKWDMQAVCSEPHILDDLGCAGYSYCFVGQDGDNGSATGRKLEKINSFVETENLWNPLPTHF